MFPCDEHLGGSLRRLVSLSVVLNAVCFLQGLLKMPSSVPTNSSLWRIILHICCNHVNLHSKGGSENTQCRIHPSRWPGYLIIAHCAQLWCFLTHPPLQRGPSPTWGKCFQMPLCLFFSLCCGSSSLPYCLSLLSDKLPNKRSADWWSAVLALLSSEKWVRKPAWRTWQTQSVMRRTEGFVSWNGY